MSNRVTLLLIAVLTLSSLIAVEAAPTSAYVTPSVPEFTLKLESHSYDVPPTYSVDRYTGEKVITQYGYHVENKSIVVTIKNQPFTPYTEADGNVTSLSYSVRVKGHFEEGWTELRYIASSDSGYTITSYALGENAGYEILRNVPTGGKLDFQVEARLGYYTRIMPSCYQYNDVFTGQTSGWSNTQSITIGESQTTPTPLPATPEPSQPTQKTKLTLECRSSTSYSNFKVDISGSLTFDGAGIANVPILLSYSVDRGETWVSLTTVNTGGDGDFTAVWTPSVSGNNLLKAVWAGDAFRSAVSTTVNFAVTPFEQNVFSVTTNSVLRELFFDSANRELSFRVEGPDGTTGYVNVYVSKAFLSSVSGLKVYLDGNELSYATESQDDSWIVSFAYSHSAHQVTISLSSAALDESQIGQALMIGLPIVAVVLFFAVTRIKDRKSKNNAE